VSFVELEN
jgi:dynein heavy chain, axonemal